MTERVYCSQENPHEPMIGTADRVDVWLLLEYRPVWKARAVEESSLGEAARRWLDESVAALAQRGLKVRVQFIRRPEIDSDHVCLMIGLPGALLAFSGRGYGFLETVDVRAVVDDPAAHPQVEGPCYFVCTNGQRDVCCARFGLPVYAGLRERVGGRVWQTTHLGGHRFAPNVLVLPQGTLYGRVDADALDEFVGSAEAGRLAFANLRGRTWYPPPVQAAEVASGESDLTFEALEGDETAAAVRFSSGQREVVIRVRAAEPLRVLKSCADEDAKPVTPYVAG